MTGDWLPLAVGSIACPHCGEDTPVPVEYRIIDKGNGRRGMETRPDVSAMWTHDWTHTAREAAS